MDYLELTSTQNPKYKQLMHLKDKRERDQSGLFTIEGYREISRAISGGIDIQAVFFCPELFLGSNEYTLIDTLEKNGALIHKVTENLFSKLSYRDRPDGLLVLADQFRVPLPFLEEKFSNSSPFLVIAEAIEKPGNLGSILRSSDGAGVDGVIVCDRCTDIYNPNVIRSSVGTLFTVPTLEAKSADILPWLRKNKIQILAATPHASVEYTQVDLTGPIAIAVGTEQLGLTKGWMESADIKIKIPMLGVADSLNVSVATSLILYEVVRQRRHGHSLR